MRSLELRVNFADFWSLLVGDNDETHLQGQGSLPRHLPRATRELPSTEHDFDEPEGVRARGILVQARGQPRARDAGGRRQRQGGLAFKELVDSYRAWLKGVT